MTNPSKATELIFDTVGRPVSTASLFYTLYWLSEIKQVDEVDFDFVQLRNKLHKGFYYYGLYTVAKEAYNGNAMHVRRTESEEREGYEGSNNLRSQTDENVERIVRKYYPDGMDDRVLAWFHNNKNRKIRPGYVGRKSTVKKTIEGMEKYFNMLSEPDEFLDLMEAVFDVGHITDNTIRWETAFGGNAWTGIVRHMRMRDELPKTAWVDQSFAVQHNTQNWMNKIEVEQEEAEVLFHELSDDELYDALTGREKEVMRTQEKEAGPNLHPEDLLMSEGEIKFDRVHVLKVLGWVLDANHEGDMEVVLRYAKLFRDRVDINFMRYVEYR